jgi:GNAT superfamily N-acetyltransferase
VRDPFIIRSATAADAAIISHQRVGMWVDMGVATPEIVPELLRVTTEALAPILESGEYAGWLAAPADEPSLIVAGAGVHFRPVLPLPVRRPDGSVFIEPGRHPTVVNVYTERAYRRRGIARLLMERIIAWAPGAGVTMLFLHASPEGKALYESLGFAPSADMRLSLHGLPPR